MLIKKIQIENFGCYYKLNEFTISSGLNIILAGNGEGKTMFYEAINWLFEGDANDQRLESLKCEKRYKEINVGESFKVKVSISLDWNEKEIVINRSFLINKEESKTSVTGNSLDIKEKKKNGELELIDDPQRYLDSFIFPYAIREYSMFKGESRLDIFKNEESLINLINLFSNAKKYDRYSKGASFLAKKAEDELAAKSKVNDSQKKKYKILESEIVLLNREIQKLQDKIKNTDKEIFNNTNQIDQLKKGVNNQTLIIENEKKIKLHEDRIDELQYLIKDNYTESLFDQFWILQNFSDYYNDFSKIISKASKERIKAQKEFHQEQGLKKIGIIGGKTPLPVYVPNKEIMQQLLDEEICKVCNREAKKGSPPYLFMSEKLKELVNSEKVDTEDNELFKQDTIRDLDIIKTIHDRDKKSFNGIKKEIKDTMVFNEDRKIDIRTHQKKIKDLQDEMDKVTGKTGFTSESAKSSINNLSTLMDLVKENEFDKKRFLEDLKNKEEERIAKQSEKDKIDNKSGSISEQETRDILRDVNKIFNDTKTEKFHQFIDKIENVSNKFLKEINTDSFTGEIKFDRNITPYSNSVKLELHVNDKLFSNPNQSLLTSVYISILFSISELSKETKEEYFPLIFDAPTSTFDDKKISQFLNSIYNTPTQKIIVTKDFVIEDDEKEKDVIKISNDFKKVKRDKSFWVKLKRPFNRKDLATLQAEIKEI